MVVLRMACRVSDRTVLRDGPVSRPEVEERVHLRVVGRDHEDVCEHEGARHSIRGRPARRAPEQVGHEPAHRLHHLRRLVRAPVVLDVEHTETGTLERRRAVHALPLEPGPREQAVLVVQLRGECAELRMEPPGVVEEEAAVRREGRPVAEQVLQRRVPKSTSARRY
jgi:hypothetical protein